MGEVRQAGPGKQHLSPPSSALLSSALLSLLLFPHRNPAMNSLEKQGMSFPTPVWTLASKRVGEGGVCEGGAKSV